MVFVSYSNTVAIVTHLRSSPPCGFSHHRTRHDIDHRDRLCRRHPGGRDRSWRNRGPGHRFGRAGTGDRLNMAQTIRFNSQIRAGWFCGQTKQGTDNQVQLTDTGGLVLWTDCTGDRQSGSTHRYGRAGTVDRLYRGQTIRFNSQIRAGWYCGQTVQGTDNQVQLTDTGGLVLWTDCTGDRQSGSTHRYGRAGSVDRLYRGQTTRFNLC